MEKSLTSLYDKKINETKTNHPVPRPYANITNETVNVTKECENRWQSIAMRPIQQKITTKLNRCTETNEKKNYRLLVSTIFYT